MIIILIDVLRYLVSGLFIFSIYNKIPNFVFKKVFMLSIIYTAFITAFKCFISDSPIITFISTIIVFFCLLITNELKKLKFSITYSLFISCLLECSHFLIFKTISITREVLGITEVTYKQPERLIISRVIVLVMYLFIVSLIYKFKKVDVDAIKKLSDYRVFSIFLGIDLLIITYLKYYIKYTYSDDLHNILSVVFVFFIVLSFAFLLSLKTLLSIIDNFKENKMNPAIEEAKLQKAKGFSGLKFTSEKLNSEMNCFLNMLSELGMDTEDKKSKQIAYSAVILNYEEIPQNVNISNVVYPCVADILDRQSKTIECNISNAVKNLWNSYDPKILEKINRNYKKPISSETGCPTPKEFLLYLIEKYREKYSVDESKTKIKCSFIKKTFSKYTK